MDRLALSTSHADSHQSIPSPGHFDYPAALRYHVRSYHQPGIDVALYRTPLRIIEQLHGTNHKEETHR